MDQIRIVKEMRSESKRRLSVEGSDVDLRLIRPRYMVWENVAGAFSSGKPKGADFKAVLEEIVKVVVEECPDIPMPEKGWSYAGCLDGVGDDGVPFSICWRTHDAQYWGVPQRRRRISLVADFGGESAPEILFESESLSGNTEESGEEGKGTPSDSERDTDPTISFQERAGCAGGAREFSSNENGQEPCQHSIISQSSTTDSETTVYGISPYSSNCMKSDNPHSGYYEASTSRTLDNNGGNPCCNQGGMVVLEGNGSRASHKGDGYKESETMFTLNTVEQHGVCYDGSQISPTLTANNANGAQRMPDKQNFNAVIQTIAIDQGGGKSSCGIYEESSPTLATTHQGEPAVCYGLDRASFNQGQNAKYDFAIDEEKAQTIVSRGPGGVMTTPSGVYVQETTKE